MRTSYEMGQRSSGAPLAGSSFSHTRNAVYLAGFFALCCVGYDSTHEIIQRSHINKKWFYLSGATCLSAYLYVRPLIRRRLGSASSAYINYSTIYIGWLLMAVFYHLPSLESMGVNIKADVSMWLACFLGSLATLGLLHGAYGLLVALCLLDPKLYSPMAGAREVWSIVVMNSVNLAVVCSTFYSFCGNASPDDLVAGLNGTGSYANSTACAAAAGAVAAGAFTWKEAVCHKWLHPVSASSHSAFTRWVIYGEAARANASAAGGVGVGAGAAGVALLDGGQAAAGNGSVLQIDYPLDGKGMVPIPATDLVSPIFTMWLTLLLMYAANCLADYSAAATLNAAYTADLRRGLAREKRSLRRRHHRRRSADYAHDVRSAASLAASEGATSDGGASSMRDALTPFASRGSFDMLLQRTMSSVGLMLGSPTSTMRRAGSMLFRDDFGIGLATGWLHPNGAAAGSLGGDAQCGELGATAQVPIPPDAPAPSFLPMFPWYSGTSADLLKTVLDLVISVRVFLGRYDQRAMQAANATHPLGPNAPPSGGDGFTFEHLAGRDELWWDFVADTGDGGDPTYAIARCMAAQQLRVEVPPEVAAAGVGASPEGRSFASLAAGERTLPRASVVIHGGDLCYPSPTDETFETRLFGPYQDAFPPPGHVHPGHLVVNKPDLGPDHWAAAQAAAAKCRCGGASAGGACGRHCSGVPELPCRMCAKEAALRGYEGPTLFAIPGNHDWIDGLDCFQRHIQHKGWLGGWLMPQEKSYFAVALPHGWWVFGLDLALEEDLDMAQYSYFARIAEERMRPDDQAILVQHCPTWLTGWFWGHPGTAKNLRQLVRGPLKGRARIQMAGDLHFMMRHTFQQYGPGQSPSLAPSELATPAGGSPAGGSPAGGSPTTSRFSSRSATPLPGVRSGLSPSQLHQTLVNRLSSGGGGGAARSGNGVLSPPEPPLQEAPAGASPRAASPSPFGSSPDGAWGLLGGGQAQQVSRGRQQVPHGLPTGRPRRPTSEAAEAALAALTPGDSNGSSATSQPITIGSRLAGGGKATLPLLSPVRRQSPLRPAGADTPAGASPSSSGGSVQPGVGSSPFSCAPQPPSLGVSPPAGGSPPNASWWPGLRVRTSSGPEVIAGSSGPPAGGVHRTTSDAAVAGGSGHQSEDYASAASAGRLATAAGIGWSLNDPEHLVVCGSGGGFCHPTHVFSEARFRPEYVPAAGPIYVKAPTAGGAAGAAGAASAAASGTAGAAGAPPGLQRSFPSGSSLYSLGGVRNEAEARRPSGGEWRCEQAFPTPEQSLKLGRCNLTFRSVNNRFDIVGGLLYFMLVISVVPRCTGVGEVLEAHTLAEAAALFCRAGVATLASILTESYVSLAALLCVFAVLLGLCRSGGLGAMPGVPPALRRRPEFHGSTLAVRARVGGLATQLVYAGAHLTAHLLSAVSLLLLLELGIEVMMQYEGIGKDGYHSLYKWYRRFEAQNFPDPMGMRDQLQRWSLGLYPTALKWVMAAFDVPEAIAVSRTAVCAGGLAAVTRLQAVGLYLGYLAYYWLLATPTVGFLFGCYLYISVNWFHVHYDEAFSSLQIPHFKGFARFHITRSGDLEMFGLALEKVPHAWREDPRWRTPHGGGNREAPAHRAKFPSRWVPVEERGSSLLRPPRMAPPPESQLKVVDYLFVPRWRNKG